MMDDLLNLEIIIGYIHDFMGGTMPEDLPTPEQSIQQVEKE